MTTLETEPLIVSEAEPTLPSMVLPDIGELLADGSLRLNERQLNMLAYMTSLGVDVEFARRDILPYGEGTRVNRENDFSSLVKKLNETPGLGDVFQEWGSRNQRVYWFGRPATLVPDEEMTEDESSESDNETPAVTKEYSSNLGWMALAMCKDIDPNTFFPHYGADVELAQRICANCVVREDCLEYALVNRIDHGVWGGTSERERTRILKRRRAESYGQ